jgi:hypothetical protein
MKMWEIDMWYFFRRYGGLYFLTYFRYNNLPLFFKGHWNLNMIIFYITY